MSKIPDFTQIPFQQAIQSEVAFAKWKESLKAETGKSFESGIIGHTVGTGTLGEPECGV